MKKANQLGMNPSTASGRLVKDLLWNYIIKCGDNKCHQCGEEMSRENFSIEHKTPWLDSEDPIGLFFGMDNIAFSHHTCNIKAARREKAPCGKVNSYKRGCRCEECTKVYSDYQKKRYTPEWRKERYDRTGS